MIRAACGQGWAVDHKRGAGRVTDRGGRSGVKIHRAGEKAEVLDAADRVVGNGFMVMAGEVRIG
jgi:hypothetical protein